MQQNSTVKLVLTTLGFVLLGVFSFSVVYSISKPYGKAICNWVMEQEREIGDEKIQAVEVTPIVLSTISKRVNTVGVLDAKNLVKLSSEISGTISEIHFKEGDDVQKGDLLIQFDDAVLSAELAEAKAQLTSATIEHNQQIELKKRNLGKGQDYDKASAELATAKAKVELKQAQMDQAKILAPFEGTIGIIKYSEGSFVQSATELVTLVDNRDLIIEFKVPERFLADVSVGQMADVRIDAYPDQVFKANVVAVDSHSEKSSHSVTISATVQNKDGKLRAGLFGDVSLIIGDKPDAVVVPEASVFREGNNDNVWIRDADGKATRRRVVTGTRENGKVEILNGLRPDEGLITSGHLALRDGLKVAVKNGTEPVGEEEEKTKKKAGILAPIKYYMMAPLRGVCKLCMGKDDQHMESVKTVDAIKTSVEVLSRRIMAVGVLDANKGVMINSQIAGKIADIHFKEGEDVQKGDTLIQFDDAILKADLEQSLADLEGKKIEYDRQMDLRSKNIAERQRYDRAVADYAVAKARVEIAQAKLAQAKIVAPFDGTVGIIKYSEGAYVQAGKELVMLVDNNVLSIEFKIPERYLNDIGMGQMADVKVEGGDDTVIKATVEAIDSYVDKASHTIKLLASFPNTGRKLRTGLFANVSLVVGEKGKSISVPEAALQRLGDIEFVSIVKSNKIENRRVLTGMREGGNIEILKGLGPDELVVTSGHVKIYPGARVRILNMPELYADEVDLDKESEEDEDLDLDLSEPEDKEETDSAEEELDEKPAAEPAAAEPAAAEPAAEPAEPVAVEPTAVEPVEPAEPAEPTAVEPAEPTAAEPTAVEPTAVEPTAAEPAEPAVEEETENQEKGN